MRLTYLKALVPLVASFLRRSEKSQALRALGVSTLGVLWACTFEICMLPFASSRELPLDNMVAKCHFSSINPHLISAGRGFNEVQTTSACGPVKGFNLRAAGRMLHLCGAELVGRHFGAMGVAVPKCGWDRVMPQRGCFGWAVLKCDLGKAALALGWGRAVPRSGFRGVLEPSRRCGVTSQRSMVELCLSVAWVVERTRAWQ